MKGNRFCNVNLAVVFIVVPLISAVFIPNENSTSLSVLMGESVHLNCTLSLTSANGFNNRAMFNPTWLKADAKYNDRGRLVDYKTDGIIVTRKGMVVDAYRDKVKLSTVRNQIQTLTLVNVDATDEGKYICREFNSNHDQFYFIQVYGEYKF
jgi:hypothetical protein